MTEADQIVQTQKVLANRGRPHMTVGWADHAFFNTLTKNPSVPVRLGVISQPSAD
jgi:hypothetical protein